MRTSLVLMSLLMQRIPSSAYMKISTIAAKPKMVLRGTIEFKGFNGLTSQKVIGRIGKRSCLSYQSLESQGIDRIDANIPSSRYEILLAELAFSNPMEFPQIVEANMELLDETFYNCASRTLNEGRTHFS